MGGSPGSSGSVLFTGAPDTDTDGDGLADLLEFAMGSSWISAADRATTNSELIANPVGAPAGTYLVFSFPRNLLADGIIFEAQQSLNLSDWSSAGLVYFSTNNNGNGTATVKYRSSMPVENSSNRGYQRMRISIP